MKKLSLIIAQLVVFSFVLGFALIKVDSVQATCTVTQSSISSDCIPPNASIIQGPTTAKVGEKITVNVLATGQPNDNCVSAGLYYVKADGNPHPVGDPIYDNLHALGLYGGSNTCYPVGSGLTPTDTKFADFTFQSAGTYYFNVLATTHGGLVGCTGNPWGGWPQTNAGGNHWLARCSSNDVLTVTVTDNSSTLPEPPGPPPPGPNCLAWYNLWRAHFGTVPGGANYDARVNLNNDSIVDIRDYGVWRDHAYDEAWCSNILNGPPPPPGVSGGSISATASCNGNVASVQVVWTYPQNVHYINIDRVGYGTLPGLTGLQGSGNYVDSPVSSSTAYAYKLRAAPLSVNDIVDLQVASVNTPNCVPSPPPPAACAGFTRACTTGTGEAGTQWCAPGVLNGSACVAGDSTACYKSQQDLTAGCNPTNVPAGCSSAYPDGLQNSGQIMPDGTPIFITDSVGGVKAISLNKSAASVLQTPDQATFLYNGVEYRQIAPSEGAIPIVPSTVDPNKYAATLPQNRSLDTDVVFVITGKVRNPGANVDAICPKFAIKESRSVPDTSCPTSITSTEARLRKGTDAWSTQYVSTLGDSVQVGGFHNNRTNQLASDAVLKITGPLGPNSTTVDLYTPGAGGDPNAVFFTPTLPGTYTINAITKDKTGANCSGVAGLTVNKKQVVTVSYKISSTPEGLDTAPSHPYNKAPIGLAWSLTDATPGTQNFIWVEFTDSEGKTDRENIAVNYAGPDPSLSNIDCVLTVDGKGADIKVSGDNLGIEKGKVTADNVEMDIVDWQNKSINAHLTLSNYNAASFKPPHIIVARTDGTTIQGVCNKFGLSQLSLGANVFCRSTSTQGLSNVKLTLLDSSGAKIDGNVTIDQDGVIQGLTTPLQAGKTYSIAVKAPKSLTKVATFVAGTGTTIVPNFTLPIGDIYPLSKGDGTINSADKAELNREWLVGTSNSGAERAGDFNQDGKVNSIDWACMRFDFGKSDETAKPPVSTPTPPPSPSPTASLSPSASPATSPSASP